MRFQNAILVMGIAITLIFSGCMKQGEKPSLDDQMKNNQNQSKYEKNIVNVNPMNLTEVITGSKQISINVSGTMEPIRQAVINSKEDGTCIGYLSKDKRQPGTPGELPLGTKVKAGDILVELEELTMDQQIVNLETQLKTMKYGVGTDKVNEAESALTLAKKNYENMQDLFKKKSITETQFDAAKMQYEQAQAGYDKLMLSIDAMEKNLEVLKRRQADLMVRAPFDGRITNVFINPGELAAGMAKTPVVSIVDDSVLYFTFGIPEEYANLINKETTTLRITLNDRVLADVKIANISPVVDARNRSIICEARIENDSENPIIAGIFAKAEVMFEIAGTFVPDTAIASDEDQDYIFVQSNIDFQKVKVESGKSTIDNFVQLLENTNKESLVGAKIVRESQARMLDADIIRIGSSDLDNSGNQNSDNSGMNQ